MKPLDVLLVRQLGHRLVSELLTVMVEVKEIVLEPLMEVLWKLTLGMGSQWV